MLTFKPVVKVCSIDVVVDEEVGHRETRCRFTIDRKELSQIIHSDYKIFMKEGGH